MQYITSVLGLLSRLSLFVVFTPILAGWFFVWMVIATGFAWFAWLIAVSYTHLTLPTSDLV